MDDKSTTVEDNSAEELNPGSTTDSQTTDNGDNLDDTSKSTDTSAGGDSNNTNEDEGDNPAPKFDTDLDEWAEKTGRAKPETDRERELYQEIRDGQREFSRTRQAKDATNDIQKAIQDAAPADDKSGDEDDDEEDEIAKTVRELKAEKDEEKSLRLRSEYFTEKSVTADEAKLMGDILKEKVAKGGKAAYDYWTHPDQLQDWHDLAKARIALSTDTAAIAEEAARKERERIAKESQASGGGRNASQTQPAAPKGYSRTEFLKSDD